MSGQHPRMVPQEGPFPGVFVSTAGAMFVILVSRGAVTVPVLLRGAWSATAESLALETLREYIQTPPGQLASKPQRKYLTDSHLQSKQENQRVEDKRASLLIFATPVGEAVDLRGW